MADDEVLATLRRIEESQKRFNEGMAVEVANMHAILSLLLGNTYRITGGSGDSEQQAEEVREKVIQIKEDQLPSIRKNLGLD